jgi:hypothetical protein
MVDSFSARSRAGSGAAANSAVDIGVSVVPGETLFTRIPCTASSAAKARVMATTPRALASRPVPTASIRGEPTT